MVAMDGDDVIEDDGDVCATMEFWGRTNGFWLAPCELVSDSLDKEVRGYLESRRLRGVAVGEVKKKRLHEELQHCFGTAWKSVGRVRVWELVASCRGMTMTMEDGGAGTGTGPKAGEMLNVVWSGWRRGRRCVRILHVLWHLGGRVYESPLVVVVGCMRAYDEMLRGSLVSAGVVEDLDGGYVDVLLGDGENRHLMNLQDYCKLHADDGLRALEEQYGRWGKLIAGIGDGEWRLGTSGVWMVHHLGGEVVRMYLLGSKVELPRGNGFIRGPCWAIEPLSLDARIYNALVWTVCA